MRELLSDTVPHPGTRSFLGRHLAQDILRSVLARVAERYRFKLADGETATNSTYSHSRVNTSKQTAPCGHCHQADCIMSRTGLVWTCIVSSIILTTMQTQDQGG